MKIINVEQGSQEWHKIREGVVTGTGLKRVMGATWKDYVYELIAETVAPPKENVQSEAMLRGIALEKQAIEKYEAETGEIAEEAGFCISDENEWHGHSPDALVKMGDRYYKGIEVKCPDTKTHIKYVATGKVPAEYKWQIVNYFLVCDELEEVDFVSYDPRVTFDNLKLSIVNVQRADYEVEIEQAKEKLQKFREEWEKINDELVW